MDINFYIDPIYFYIWLLCGLAVLIFEFYYELKKGHLQGEINYKLIPVVLLYFIVWPYILHEQIKSLRSDYRFSRCRTCKSKLDKKEIWSSVKCYSCEVGICNSCKKKIELHDYCEECYELNKGEQ